MSTCGCFDPHRSPQPARVTRQHQLLTHPLIQQPLKQLQPFRALQQPLPRRGQIRLRLLLVRDLHPSLAPQRPVDRQMSSLTGGQARIRLLKAIADRVVTRAKVPQHRGARGEVADEVNPLPAQHPLQHHTASNLRPQYRLELSQLFFQDAPAASHPGCVDHSVDRSMRRQPCADDRPHLLLVTDIRRDVQHRRAQLLQPPQLFALALIQLTATGENQLRRVLLRQMPRKHQPQPSGSSGNQVRASLAQPHARRSRPRRRRNTPRSRRYQRVHLAQTAYVQNLLRPLLGQLPAQSAYPLPDIAGRLRHLPGHRQPGLRQQRTQRASHPHP